MAYKMFRHPMPAVFFQPIFGGVIVGKRTTEAGERQFLFRWNGDNGENHEAWKSRSQIKAIVEGGLNDA